MCWHLVGKLLIFVFFFLALTNFKHDAKSFIPLHLSKLKFLEIFFSVSIVLIDTYTDTFVNLAWGLYIIVSMPN